MVTSGAMVTKDRPKVSLCVIHRRAGSQIAKLLSSVRMLFDEYVFVDTGPLDTDEDSILARKFLGDFASEHEGKAAVVLAEFEDEDEWEWEGQKYISDFSAARNYAHELASGDWTAFLDADDELALEHSGRQDGFLHALTHEGNCAFADYEYQPGVLAQDRIWAWDESIPWRWKGQLHEERVAHGRARVVASGPVGRIIHHPRGDHEGRNMAMLEELIRRNADLTPRMVLAFGAGRVKQGRAKEAEEAFLEVTETGNRRQRADAFVALGSLAAMRQDNLGARALFGSAMVLDPEGEAKLYLARLEYHEGNLVDAGGLYKELYIDPGHGPAFRRYQSPRLAQLEGRIDASRVFCALGWYRDAEQVVGHAPHNYRTTGEMQRAELDVRRHQGRDQAARAFLTATRFLLAQDEADVARVVAGCIPGNLLATTEAAKARKMVAERVRHLETESEYEELYDEVNGADLVEGGYRHLSLVETASALAGAGGKVMDIGCNTGWVSAELAERGFDVLGVDVSPARIEAAQKRDSKARFVCADPCSKAFAEVVLKEAKSYDVVICSEVIEHVPQPSGLLFNCQLLLKSSGHLLLTTPDAELYKEIAPRAELLDLDDDVYVKHKEHVRVYDVHRLVKSMHAVGLEPVRVIRDRVDSGVECLLVVAARPGALPQMTGKVTIYAPSPMPWGPRQHEKGFSGGSEQAVEHLTPLLRQMGWDVHVYASGLRWEDYHEGVWWHHLERFDPELDHGIVVVWRDSEALTRLDQQGVWPLVFWAHDVPQKEVASDYDRATDIIVLSDFHEKLFRESVSSGVKLHRLGNGILPGISEGRLSEVSGDPLEDDRDPHRAIYCSSAGRGLLALLRMWPMVLDVLADARLEVCYDMALLLSPQTPDYLRGLADECEELMGSLEGVTYHGGLPHARYLDLAAQCGIWAYPTVFPEIYCIVSAEMQALGLLPVTTDKGALAEMVIEGSILPWEILADELGLDEHQRKTGLIYDLPPRAYSSSYVRMLTAAMEGSPTRMRRRGKQLSLETEGWSDSDRLNLAREAQSSYDWTRIVGAFNRTLGGMRKWQPPFSTPGATPRKSPS